MKTDHHFPPPPQFNQPPLRCDDISPARQRALNRLSEFAAVAESRIGTLNCEPRTENSELPFPSTARGFALHVFSGSPFADEVAELLSRSKINIVADDHIDAPHVMLIDPRQHWGVLGPIRGDITLFADGHAAVVTKPLCMGCQHFEAVSLVSSDGPPQIALLTHWTSTVRWIVRVVDESEEPNVEPPVITDSFDHLTISIAAEASSEQRTENGEPSKRKRKLTGV